MSEIDKKPSDFDWVSARLACSLQSVFESLRLGIVDDVETRNGSLPDNPDKPTLAVKDNARVIRVYWEDLYNPGLQTDKFVEFSLTPQAIVVKNETGVWFEATVGLDDNGDCKVNMGGKLLDLWQVRKKTLEPLLFGNRQ